MVKRKKQNGVSKRKEERKEGEITKECKGIYMPVTNKTKDLLLE